MHGAAIAVEQEARQRRGQHHRIADGDVADRAADLVLAPGHRHHARGAGEVRDVEHDLGGAVGLDGDDAGIERERLLRRRRALQLGRRRVAAGPDLAARALHAVDELAVEVADVGGEPALAEIVVVGRRRLVAGQVEDADIDRGDDDARLLAGGEPADLDRNAQRAVRTQQRRQARGRRASVRALRSIENHCTPMARPGMRSACASSGRRKRGDHIGAAAPVAADRDAQPRGARRHVLRHGVNEPVADHVERDLAGGARGHRDRHALARHVFGLVERDLEQVRRVGARLGVPAGVEGDRGHRPVAVAGRHFEPIAAPLHRHRDARRLVGGDVDLAVGDAPRRLHRLEVPDAVAAVPLIAGLDLEQLVAQAAARERGSVGRDQDDVEGRILALAERAAGEQRLDADHRRRRRHRQRELALDRAAARLPPCAR